VSKDAGFIQDCHVMTALVCSGRGSRRTMSGGETINNCRIMLALSCSVGGGGGASMEVAAALHGNEVAAADLLF